VRLQHIQLGENKGFLSSQILSAAGSNKVTDSLFDAGTFLRDNVDAPSRPFVAQPTGTQMFNRFVEDRVFSPMLPKFSSLTNRPTRS
jgi:hypothetical protein